MDEILIVGASGYLGSRLFKAFEGHAKGTFCTHYHPDLMFLNLSDEDTIKRFITDNQPNLILFVAGLTNVDECQNHPSLAFQINQKAVEIIATVPNIKIIYYSTDYVFDGKTGKYDEEALPNPINVYGQSKWLGEKAVLSCHPNNAVIRVSGLFGETGFENDRFSKLISSSQTLFAEDDRFSSPIHLEDVVSATKIIINDNLNGIFHLGGPTTLSRYEFQQLLAYYAPIHKKIIAVRNQSKERRAPRPLNTSLVSKRLSNLGWSAMPVPQALQRLFKPLEYDLHAASSETLDLWLKQSDIQAILVDCVGGLLTKRTWLTQNSGFDRIDELYGELNNEQELLSCLKSEEDNTKELGNLSGKDLGNLSEQVALRYTLNPFVWSKLCYWKTQYKLALTNNGLSRTFRLWVNRYGLDIIFDTLVNSSELGMRKTNPEFFLKVADLLDVSPVNCLVIDDDEWSLKSASQCGMKVVQTYPQNGFPLVEHQFVPFSPPGNSDQARLQTIRYLLAKRGYVEKSIDLSTSLRWLGLDSMETLLFLSELEKMFNLRLDGPIILDQVDNLQSLIQILKTKTTNL